MNLRPGRLQDLIKSNQDAGAALVCHDTLDDGDGVLCNGYFTAYGQQTQSVQVYERLGGEWDYIDPANYNKNNNSQD
jgi:hypothetical protein